MRTLSRCRLVYAIVVVGMLALANIPVAQAGVISSIARGGSSTDTPPELVSDGLVEDALCFVDRTHVYNNIPSSLVGLDYVKPANDDRSIGDYTLDVTLSADAMVSVILDTRVNGGDPLPWMDTLNFMRTADTVDIDESNDGSINQTPVVYVTWAPAGTLTLGAQDQGGTNMYGVAAVAAAEPAIIDFERRNPDGNSGDTDPEIVFGGMVENTEAFVDRTHILVNIPTSILGADLLRLPNDDKDNPNFELDVTTGQDATLYLLLDDRVAGGAPLPWMADGSLGATFYDRGEQADIDESANGSIDQHFSVFAAEVGHHALDGFHIWANPGTGDWTVGANWEPGTAPGVDDRAYIDNGGTARLTTTAVIDSFSIGWRDATTGTVELGPGTWLIAGGTATSHVGENGTGILAIEPGAQLDLTGQLVVGQYSGSLGVVNQTGGFVTVQGSERLYLGYDAGAIGIWSISDGSLTVGGHLAVGENGTGIVSQSGGVVSANNLRLGYHAGDGTYAMSNGDLIINEDAYIGDNGTGDFTQTGGTVAVTRDLQVGRNGTAVGTYTLGGTSTLNVGRDMAVGYNGNGTYTMGGTSTLNVGRDMAVGWNGDGTFIQNGGDVVVGGYLNIGDNASGVGRYEIHGGTLTTGDDIEIGYPGVGVFVQTGGTVSIDSGDDLDIGQGSAGHGTYELSGGILNVGDDLTIGHQNQATGIFNQSGGTLNVNDEFRVAYEGEAIGVYTMTGGVVNCGDFMVIANQDNNNGTANLIDGQIHITNDALIGHEGTGTMTQTGGVFDVGDDILIGNNTDSVGSYSLSGAASQLLVYDRIRVGNNGAGTFTMTGGTVQAQDFFLADSNDGSGTVTITGGSLTFTDDVHIGDQGPGTMTLTNAPLSVGDQLRVGNNAGTVATLDISGAQVTVGGETNVGYDGTGTLTLSDGATLTMSNRLYIGRNGSGDGTVTVSGAATQVTTNNHLAVGDYGTGVMTVTDSQVEARNLRVGYHTGTGTLTLTGGQLTITEDAYVGDNGLGTFTQTNATTAVTRDLRVGGNAGATGAYTIGGTSSLSVGRNMTVGYVGTGAFSQSGGTLTIGGYLNVGDSGTGIGSIDLSGTQVTVAGETNVGDDGVGTMALSNGATLTTSNRLYIGRNATGNGTVNVSGAATTLTTNNHLAVGSSGTGVLNMSDGTVEALNLRVGYQANGNGTLNLGGGQITIGQNAYVGDNSVGTVNQTGGTLDVSGEMAVGQWNTGTYNQTDGAVSVNGLFYIGQNTSGDGTYEMSGGTLNINNRMRVGNSGTGVFNQSDGAVTVGNGLDVEIGRGGTGTYRLSGGTVDVADDFVVGHENAGTGFLYQSGGAITVPDGFRLGQSGGTSGTYEVRDGSLTTDDLMVGQSGQGYMSVLGSAATITLSDDFSQNNQSTLRAAIHNEGISRIDVASNATVSSGAMLDVDIWGGVLFAGPGSTYEIMRTATAGNIAGAYTVVDAEPIWTVIQDGTVVAATVAATLPAADLDPNRWVEVAINAGAGSVTDMLPIQGLHPGEMTWLAIDLVDILGGDLSPAEVADIADKMIEAGQDVKDSGWVLDAHPGYDLFFEGPAPGSELYFGWDFSDYDPNVAIASVRAGIPEPATMALLGLGALALLRRRRR